MTHKSHKDSPKDRTSNFISDNKSRLLGLAERLESVNSSSDRSSPSNKKSDKGYNFK